MKNLKVGFAGHRHSWHCDSLEVELKEQLLNLIAQGASTFFVTKYGYFNECAVKVLNELKSTYNKIKIVKVLAFYNHKEVELKECFDESIFPDVELVHHKGRIKKCNEWIVDNSDIVVCGIKYVEHSGAYDMMKYAKLKNKEIILL